MSSMGLRVQGFMGFGVLWVEGFRVSGLDGFVVPWVEGLGI